MRHCPSCGMLYTINILRDPNDHFKEKPYCANCKAIVPEELKQREEDQPLPKPNDLPSMHDLLIEDIKKRKDVGIRRYGSVLQPFNGRNFLQDIYEELLDAAAYIRGLMYEQSERGDSGNVSHAGVRRDDVGVFSMRVGGDDEV